MGKTRKAVGGEPHQPGLALDSYSPAANESKGDGHCIGQIVVSDDCLLSMERAKQDTTPTELDFG